MASSSRAVWPEDGYPRFSDGEMRRRRVQLAQLVERSGVDRLVLYGSAGSGDAVQWFTGWPVTREAAAVWAPGEAVKLFVPHGASPVGTRAQAPRRPP